MRKVKDVKTEWALKALLLFVAALGIILLGIRYSMSSPKLKVGNQTISLMVASDQVSREKGLGGRPYLANNEAMLFVFDDVTQECFWMKDMKFPIDIVWLSTSKRVVHIEKNIYPASYPKTYCSMMPAKYVIELNNGYTDSLNIKEGQALNF